MAAAGNYKVPPPFDEKTSYESWKNEIEIWRLVTDLDKKKQALAVTLSLSGRARESALEIAAEHLNVDTGMSVLLDKLDSVFLKEEKDRQYEAYTEFDRIDRRGDTSMMDYIIEFERRYNKLRKFKMELPDAVLAFKLLDTAGLNVKDKQLALTACSTVTFDNMKSALKRIFGDNVYPPQEGDSAFFTKYTGKRERSSNSEQSSRTAAGTNPLDKYGRRTKCAICQSTFHWAKDCPNKREHVKLTNVEGSKDNVEECNITLFSDESTSDTQIFMVEALGSAVIDTACTRTVCGEKWLADYVSGLPQRELMKIKDEKSARPFRFGDGKLVQSTRKVTIPATIGKTKCNIETEVVPADIPMLLSKTSLKRASAVLDIAQDKAMMFDQPVKLELTSSGHYCVNLRKERINNESQFKQSETPNDEDEILIVTENMATKEKKTVLLKLHKQFGHASVDRLQKLLSCSGNTDDESITILKEIVKNCEICIRYSRAKPKPAVGLPMASTYNETVAMDLHELEPGLWYLHAIDHFTRFSAGSIITTKKPKEIVKHFIHCWISVHGPPRRLFTDNGGEFNNEEIRDMAEHFNIEVKATAGYSPWSNGLLERHNQILTEMLLKVKRDNKCDWKMALDWALMAKNSMHNVHGYSPYQLVFGQNPNLPSVLIDKPPALETDVNTWMGHHTATLHGMRKAFAEAECSERIRRALRKQLRPTDDKYETGDKVYYKRTDCQEWKGPGVVIGQDGVVIFVRHGGTYVRVHQSRLRKMNETQEKLGESESKNPFKTDDHLSKTPAAVLDEEHDFESEHEEVMAPTSNESLGVAENSESSCDPVQPEGDGLPLTNTTVSEGIKLKAGQGIKFTDKETGQKYAGKITSRAGKASGKHKNWYNLEYTEPEEIAGSTGSIDMGQVSNLEVVENVKTNTYNRDEILVVNEDIFSHAKQTELENWKRNNVFVEEKDEGQKCISTRWVCTLKKTQVDIVPKARLVARGFEEINIQELPKDSPTCSSESLKMVIAVICQNKWKLNSMDIKAAFLQGKDLTRDVYLRPPQEAESEGIVWKLNKCVYGLADASLFWYNKVKETMQKLGGTVSKVDPAVFYWQDDFCKVTGVLACHVDDFVWGGSDMFSSAIIPQLKTAFQVGREEHNSFNYIGMEVHSLQNEIRVQQRAYIKNLQPIPMDPIRAPQREAPLTDTEMDMLKSKIGQILWVARQSRPDIMCDISILASNTKHGTIQTLHSANKLIRKLKSEEVTLRFQCLGDSKYHKLVVFSDSSMGNLSDGGTQGGHFVMLMGEDGKFSPICWQSRRIRRVVRSTLAGETLALADGIDSAVFLATLYSELMVGDGTRNILPITCVTDNHSLLDAVKSTKCVTEKRLRLEISSIKELMGSGTIQEIIWTPTKDQLANCLTKVGASALGLLRALSEGKWQLKD